MTLPKENLDNKAFEDLVKEAISRIPVYAPGWTDHNIHDPGITFIELFAWLTEMQIYRLNRINNKNYRKFLKLIGIPKLKSAGAAKVDVTFSLRPGFTQANVPAGTRVAATDPVTGEDILYATEEDLKVINIESEEITVLSLKVGEIPINNSEANKNDDHYFYAFRPDEQPEEGDELYIGFKHNPGTEIVLAFYFQYDEPFNKEENSVMVPSGRLDWCYYSEGVDNWKSIKESEITDETFHFSINGKIRLEIADGMKKTDVGEVKDLFWLKCKVNNDGYHNPPKIDRILLNTVSAVHAIKYTDVKFSSNGLPDFYIDLKNVPVLDTTESDKKLTVNKDEIWTEVKGFDASRLEDRHYVLDLASMRVIFGNGINGKIPPKGTDNITISYSSTAAHAVYKNSIKLSSSGLPSFYIDLKSAFAFDEKLDKKFTVNVNEWTEVEDFDASKPEDQHYTVNFASGRVTFGDGINGKIPQKGTDNIRVSYCSGGGLCGNVKARAITRILDNTSLDERVKVTNIEAASGGTEAETLEEAIQRARKELKEVTRAVTSEDYEYLALNTPGLQIARAKALPRYHPSKDREVPGIVSIIVVPESPSNNPIPSQNFLKAVYKHLDEHRLLTTELFVLVPVYVEISVKVEVVVKPKSLPAQVKKDIENKLQKFLHPISGGFDGKGWPFGRSVYISEIYELIDGVEGVDYVKSVTLNDNDKTVEIDAPAEGLISLTKSDITASEDI